MKLKEMGHKVMENNNGMVSEIEKRSKWGQTMVWELVTAGIEEIGINGQDRLYRITITHMPFSIYLSTLAHIGNAFS